MTRYTIKDKSLIKVLVLRIVPSCYGEAVSVTTSHHRGSGFESRYEHGCLNSRHGPGKRGLILNANRYTGHLPFKMAVWQSSRSSQGEVYCSLVYIVLFTYFSYYIISRNYICVIFFRT